MRLRSKTDKRPYLNVMFGNFYAPAYDDEAFIDETMRLVKALGYNSVMFDTKAWEDFKERCETGALSQYVKMQEYMGQSAHAYGLAYNFLLLYLNGDNLYPHIRFSPPIYGEQTVRWDGTPGKWYKYWSEKARESMREHVARILDRYGDGCERCVLELDTKAVGYTEVIPACTMWDPVVAPSFDVEGKARYLHFLKEHYGGDIEKLNRAYGTAADDFFSLRPKDYWYSLRYGPDDFYTEADVDGQTAKFLVWRDNALWKMRELELYFCHMQRALKQTHPALYLCPNMAQWGYFLNIYGRTQEDLDNGFSDLWDTALRGIDIYALAPYVDCCHFMTVPVSPDGYPDAYTVSCQHSMMRVMNEGRPMIGGIYWGRYIYNDLYAFLTPAEIIGTMTACGIDGYTSYGINGLDDGGVLNRMEPDFLESLAWGNRWCAEVIRRRGGARKKEIALLFPSEMAHLEPYEVGRNKIRRLDLSGWYRLCCDLGYQVDVISTRQIDEGRLSDYRILIAPANDCYGSLEHPDTEAALITWVKNGGTFVHGPLDLLSKSCFGIYGEPCEKMPYRYDSVIIPQGERFCTYKDGVSVADYTDGGGCCVAAYSGSVLAQMARDQEQQNETFLGTVYAFGVQIGASYASKNIPHVPYGQGNKEMYPFALAKTALVKDLLNRVCMPCSKISARNIETGVFENGMVIVNHRSTPFKLPKTYADAYYQIPAGMEAADGVLAAHAAVWVSAYEKAAPKKE